MKMVALGEIVEFLDHLRKPITAADRITGPYPYYGANGQQGTIDSYIFDEPLLLLAEDGGHFDNPSRGIAYKIAGRSWVNNHAHVLRMSPTLDLSFAHHILSNMDVRKYVTGTTRAKLTKSSAAKIQVPLPPLPEQRRIAAILDHADALRAKRRQVINQLDDLKQSIFLNMFGPPASWPGRWTMGQIGDMVDDVQYGTSDKAGELGSWPIVRMGNLTDDGRLDLTDIKWIDLADSDIPKFTVKRGDLLFNRTNSKEKVGKTCVVETDTALAFAGYLVRVRLNEQHRPEFVNAYMTSRYGQALRRSMAKAAVNQANINAKEMQSMAIALPPLRLQRDFAAAQSRINRERELQLSVSGELDTLFASLQSRAFRGEL